MFEKKFKVRVRHFGEGKFVVEYANYRFIKIWSSLLFWFDQGVTANTECWCTKLFKSYEVAEEVAKKLNNYDDVLTYYIPEFKEEEKFYKSRKEYYDKHIPYQTKIIK